MDRRDFIGVLGVAGAAGLIGGCAAGRRPGFGYEKAPFGNARILHFTDCHAQLLPVYFREPNVNIGIAGARGRPPHLVGEALIADLSRPLSDRERHALTYLDFTAAAKEYGAVGGFAHLKTLVDQLRAAVPPNHSLLLDGGDTWQGSATALWTRGRDMVEACNLLGVDVMTGHWEFTYQDEEVLENIAHFNGDFVAQNVRVTEEALFDGTEAFDEDTGHAFRPYTIRELGSRRVAVIGQAFPYTPIANPSRFIPDWTFGIRDAELQELVDDIRENERPDAVVLLSHNGMDVDVKLAGQVSGIDAILGGHTHDGVPMPLEVDGPRGKTLVSNAGSNGKFLAVLDLDVGDGRVNGYEYRLLPVFSNLLPADAAMQAHIDGVREPYLEKLTEPLATAETLLYRRGNFNGSFDQVICDAMLAAADAEIALSPGFRWGTSVLPGDDITMERVMDQTAMTYPETYVREMRGEEIRTILESVADNLFHEDPYYQQGGDMVRTGGLNYSCDPTAAMDSRIGDLTLADGRRLEANKNYKVTGWATVGAASSGPPVWEVVADYLRTAGSVSVRDVNTPVLKNVSGNPGLSDYEGIVES